MPSDLCVGSLAENGRRGDSKSADLEIIHCEKGRRWSKRLKSSCRRRDLHQHHVRQGSMGSKICNYIRPVEAWKAANRGASY
jgi:hypothetical protein